jgi:hypothetical protein
MDPEPAWSFHQTAKSQSDQIDFGDVSLGGAQYEETRSGRVA